MSFSSSQHDYSFEISIDASDTGIGCILSQRDSSSCDQPVLYASKALTNNELNLHTCDKEAYLISRWGNLDHTFWDAGLSGTQIIRVFNGWETQAILVALCMLARRSWRVWLRSTTQSRCNKLPRGIIQNTNIGKEDWLLRIRYRVSKRSVNQLVAPTTLIPNVLRPKHDNADHMVLRKPPI